MALVDITQAVESLTNGKAVAIPTETVYGLAARYDREDALRAIFSIKRRPFFDPLIVHVENVEHAKNLTQDWPKIYDLLAAKFWPGPLTLLAPKADSVSSLITSGLETVALRSPAHLMAREILQRLGCPLAAPSANLFGKTSPTQAAHVEAEFSGEIPVVDGGSCALGIESTVITANFSNDCWHINIVRPGAVSRQQLREALNGTKFTLNRAHSKASPGSSKAHYQPNSPLVILEGKRWSDDVQLEVVKHLGFPVLGRDQLVLPPSPQEAARRLYAELRILSRGNKHILWIQREPHHHEEQWEVVWDRIERASSLTL